MLEVQEDLEPEEERVPCPMEGISDRKSKLDT